MNINASGGDCTGQLADEVDEITEPLRVPSHIDRDDLNCEPNYRQKARFLMDLGLELVHLECRRGIFSHIQ